MSFTLAGGCWLEIPRRCTRVAAVAMPFSFDFEPLASCDGHSRCDGASEVGPGWGTDGMLTRASACDTHVQQLQQLQENLPSTRSLLMTGPKTLLALISNNTFVRDFRHICGGRTSTVVHAQLLGRYYHYGTTSHQHQAPWPTKTKTSKGDIVEKPRQAFGLSILNSHQSRLYLRHS